MIETLTTKYTTQRMPSSYLGNPRYRLIADNGDVIGVTRVNDGISYGNVPNHADRGICTIKVNVTPTGRRYIKSVTPTK